MYGAAGSRGGRRHAPDSGPTPRTATGGSTVHVLRWPDLDTDCRIPECSDANRTYPPPTSFGATYGVPCCGRRHWTMKTDQRWSSPNTPECSFVLGGNSKHTFGKKSSKGRRELHSISK